MTGKMSRRVLDHIKQNVRENQDAYAAMGQVDSDSTA